MSNIIIYDQETNMGVFGCNITDTAYGHFMQGTLEQIEEFEKTLKMDARLYDIEKLYTLWLEWLETRSF